MDSVFKRINYTFPSERSVLGRECYITLKVRIIYTDGSGISKTLGDVPSANAFLSKNPVLCFFKSVQLNINDVCKKHSRYFKCKYFMAFLF